MVPLKAAVQANPGNVYPRNIKKLLQEPLNGTASGRGRSVPDVPAFDDRRIFSEPDIIGCSISCRTKDPGMIRCACNIERKRIVHNSSAYEGCMKISASCNDRSACGQSGQRGRICGNGPGLLVGV